MHVSLLPRSLPSTYIGCKVSQRLQAHSWVRRLELHQDVVQRLHLAWRQLSSTFTQRHTIAPPHPRQHRMHSSSQPPVTRRILFLSYSDPSCSRTHTGTRAHAEQGNTHTQTWRCSTADTAPKPHASFNTYTYTLTNASLRKKSQSALMHVLCDLFRVKAAVVHRSLLVVDVNGDRQQRSRVSSLLLRSSLSS